MKLDDFFPFVLTEVIGCPNPTLRSAILLTAVDFCSRSHAWIEFSDPIVLEENTKEYDLDAPTGSFAQTVRDVWLGSRRLHPITMSELQRVMPDWPTAQSNEPIYYNLAAQRGVLSVYPTPINLTGQALVCRTVFVPTMAATTLPDFLGQDQLEVISAGAKSRLMAMPNVQWSNPSLASYYRTLFENGVTDARIEEAHDRVPGSITVAPRAFT